MARGKFHGAMMIPTPRGHQCWKLPSPATRCVRCGLLSAHLSRVKIAEVNGFANVSVGLGPAFAGFQDFQSAERRFVSAHQ
jgi:hypothetical protein